MKHLLITFIIVAIAAIMPVTAQCRNTDAIALQAQYATAPLSFIENKGQVTDQYGKPRTDIDVKMSEGGVTMFIGKGEIHYQFSKVKEDRDFMDTKDYPGFRHGEQGINQSTNRPTNQSTEIETYRMDVVLVGANKHAVLLKEEAQNYYETYYTETTGKSGAVVHSYNRIVYKDIYPYIDWVLYSKDNELKYDFIVHPGGNAADIQLKYEGATDLQLAEGALVATTPMGSITEAAPYSYDAVTLATINSRYILEGNSLRIDVQGYTENGIVIDPVLKWGTYYGGSGDDAVFGPAIDTGNNVYICGYTTSTNNIATSGAFQQSLNSATDAFIAKFDEAGVRQWGTYYGGSGSDELHALAADGTGHIYAAGATGSASGMATAGAHQTTTTNTSGTKVAGMLLKFNASGQRIWATYYGYNSTTSTMQINDVHCDAGDVVIAGNIVNSGATGIASTGAWQTTDGGGFLAKFSSNGVRQWGTYYGGANNTVLTGISTDAFHNIYACGTSSQATGISTAGCHQPAIGGTEDGILVKFSPTGVRTWATYYGGSGMDKMRKVFARATGDVYVQGMTQSSTGIASPGAYLTSYQGSPGYDDLFIVRFSATGIRQWGTYYGGTGDEHAENITMGADGLLYFCGGTVSLTGIATPNGYKTINVGGDAYLVSMKPNGQPVYGTYYGSTQDDGASGVACSKSGKIYIAGGTLGGTNGIATPGSHQPTNSNPNGLISEGFLVQFEMDTSVYLVDDVVYLQQFCGGDTVKVVYDVTHPFRPGNVFTLQLSNSSGSFASPTNLATKTTQFGDTFKAYIPLTIPNGSGYRFRVVASTPADTTEDNGIDVTMSTYPGKPVATASTPACTGGNLNLSATSTTGGVTWSWEGPDNFTAAIHNPSISPLTLLKSGDYIVTADNNGCKSKDTIAVIVGQTPAVPSAGNNGPICTGQTLNLTSNSLTPGVSYSWSGPLTVPQVQNPSIPLITTAASGDYTVTATLGNCSSSATTNVVINPGPAIGMYVSPNDTICAGTVATFVAVPSVPIPNPQYQWLKNSVAVSGQTGLTWATAALVTGDMVSFTASGIPGCPGAVSSQPITMTVLPIITTPSVTITSVPVQPLPGNAVTFTAVVVNGGPNPQYQWQRNGVDQAGATNATWSANNLYPYEKVSVTITSNDPCANIKTATSNEIEINFPTGVKDANDGLSLHIYPNPNDGRFTLKGRTGNNELVTVQLINTIGQMVYSQTIQPKSGMIEHTISAKVAAGVYLLKAGTETVRVVVE